jgi:hypothetical protein
LFFWFAIANLADFILYSWILIVGKCASRIMMLVHVNGWIYGESNKAKKVNPAVIPELRQPRIGFVCCDMQASGPILCQPNQAHKSLYLLPDEIPEISPNNQFCARMRHPRGAFIWTAITCK